MCVSRTASVCGLRCGFTLTQGQLGIVNYLCKYVLGVIVLMYVIYSKGSGMVVLSYGRYALMNYES